MVVIARRLLQYFQLPDKNSRDISSHAYNILLYFKIVMYLFQCFSRNPKRYSVELSLKHTAIVNRLANGHSYFYESSLHAHAMSLQGPFS